MCAIVDSIKTKKPTFNNINCEHSHNVLAVFGNQECFQQIALIFPQRMTI